MAILNKTMTQPEAIKLAKANKYKVLEVEIDGKDFFIVDADPIEREDGHQWNGKTTIATCIDGGDKNVRLQDMKEDCESFYGKNSESYTKIIWPF